MISKKHYFLFVWIWISLFSGTYCSINIVNVSDSVTVTKVVDGMFVLEMNENNRVFDLDSKTPLFKMEPTDKNCSSIYINFSKGTFLKEVEDCLLSAAQSFDYENKDQRNYQMDIMQIHDGTTDNAVKVVLNILNIDDEDPIITCPKCSFDEYTIYDNHNTTCTYNLQDPDGWLDYIELTIIEENDEAKSRFILEKPSVDNFTYSINIPVYSSDQLDYKDVTSYSFSVEALDSGGNSDVTSTSIAVKDLRNTPPIWTKPLNFAQFKEKSPQEFDVTAIDGDTGIHEKICYSKIKEQEPESDYISINKNTGHITVKGIDRDIKDISMYDTTINACVCVTGEDWCTEQTISFYLEDIDDHPPLITSNQYDNGTTVPFDNSDSEKVVEISFLENFDGSFNFTSLLVDADTGKNAEFTVKLNSIGDFDYTVAYLVVPTAGYKNGNFRISVFDKTYLDFENPEHDWTNHMFYIYSYDTFNELNNDQMLLKISLIDYNDEIPIFDKESYSAEIMETVKTGEPVIRVHATDRDAEDKTLTMDIVGNYAKNRLSITSEGDITVNFKNPTDNFDYDVLQQVFFQVRATDKVGHTTTVPVTINILDVNNKPPTIESVVPVSVEENQKDGIQLNITIKASDRFVEANLMAEIDWKASYATKNSVKLESTDDNMEKMKFLIPIINPSSGGNEINIKLEVYNSNEMKPDFESFDSLYLNLSVIDLNIDPDFKNNDRASAMILISIININDNPPFFPDTNIDNRTVQEQALNGTSAGFIKASDPDIDDVITYYCNPDDEDLDWIEVNAITGSFTVKVDKLINADKIIDNGPLFCFNYSCYANDGIHDSDKLEVGFYIIDTNNKYPAIDLNMSVSVIEKSDSGTEVAQIGTSDEDRDFPFHNVVCNFQKNSSETIECFDQFLIKNGNKITVKNGGKEIDRDHGRPEFECLVECHDNDLRERSEPSLPTTQYLTIILLDINDNPPELKTSEISCLESLHEGDIVGEIIASDIDDGENAIVAFFRITSIINKDSGSDISSYFEIVKLNTNTSILETLTTGQLKALKDLKGLYGDYTLNIYMEDEGTPVQKNTGQIDFTIEKVVYSPPIIETPKNNENVLLSSSQEVGSSLTMFNETNHLENFIAVDNDSDDCSKWDVTLTVEELNDDPLDIFVLQKLSEPCEFQLQINNNFNSDKVFKKMFELKITAWLNSSADSIEEDTIPYFSSVQIKVQFLNNSQEPYFKDLTTWEFNFVENKADQTEPLTQKATYDVDNGFNIFYFLVPVDDDIEDFCSVDISTGDVSVINPFYYDDHQKFTFKILASNDSSHTSTLPMAYLDVTINVDSTNRRNPQFTSDSFFGAIMPTYNKGALVTSITATDADAVDQGKLTYNISSEISILANGVENIKPPLFNIQTSPGSDIGKIELNFYVDATMNGRFEFEVTVSDEQDKFENGPHYNTTQTTIFIITEDNTVDFNFLNNVSDVQEKQQEMLQIVAKWAEYNAYIQNIDATKDTTKQNFTIARLYFIDGTTTLKTKGEILRILTNLETYNNMANELKVVSLFLFGFSNDDSSKINTEALLKGWLTGVSVVLGIVCLVLLITLIWKTKQLTKRMSKLTTKKFGSQDSGLNRIGVSAPTTNKHAIEGSNPVYKTKEKTKPNDSDDFDTQSIRSGDSDLIGVENNPEFDYNFNTIDDKTTYL